MQAELHYALARAYAVAAKSAPKQLQQAADHLGIAFRSSSQVSRTVVQDDPFFEGRRKEIELLVPELRDDFDRADRPVRTRRTRTPRCTTLPLRAIALDAIGISGPSRRGFRRVPDRLMNCLNHSIDDVKASTGHTSPFSSKLAWISTWHHQLRTVEPDLHWARSRRPDRVAPGPAGPIGMGGRGHARWITTDLRRRIREHQDRPIGRIIRIGIVIGRIIRPRVGGGRIVGPRIVVRRRSQRRGAGRRARPGNDQGGPIRPGHGVGSLPIIESSVPDRWCYRQSPSDPGIGVARRRILIGPVIRRGIGRGRRDPGSRQDRVSNTVRLAPAWPRKAGRTQFPFQKLWCIPWVSDSLHRFGVQMPREIVGRFTAPLIYIILKTVDLCP